MSEVMVIGAHPDDESLMCAGTIARHVASGDTVRVLVLADGETARDGEHHVQGRREMFSAACKVLGVTTGEALDFQDQQLDTVPILAIIKEIEKRIAEYKPSIVYTHWMRDMNRDHRIVSEATQVACRPQPGCSVKTLLCGEVPSSTEWAGGFSPNHFVDITYWLGRKETVCKVYQPEMRPYPHPRSWPAICALSEFRGHTVGVGHAEAYELIRNIT